MHASSRYLPRVRSEVEWRNDFPRIILCRSQKLEVGFIQSGQSR
jgi:hypothetical protein